MKPAFVIVFLFLLWESSTFAQSVKDSIQVPNIFTPNGDGVNDQFKPAFTFETKFGNYKLEIYDRFGLKIFETDKSAQAWDGRTTSGMPCAQGTYFYVILFSVNQISSKHTGFLQLIR